MNSMNKQSKSSQTSKGSKAKKTALKKVPAARAASNKKNVTPAVQNEEDYKAVMTEIDRLIKVGKGTIKNNDIPYYSNLAKAAQLYEQNTYTIAPPGTLEGLLEWKMYELKLKQTSLAKKLHISDTKLSLVMSG